MKVIKRVLHSISVLLILFIVLVYTTTYHPRKVENIKPFNSTNSLILSKSKSIKILNWNVQYMAGKNYVFYYDLYDGSGKDIRPSKEDITKTFQEVVRIIKDEDPDFIILQELDINAKRTDYEDQLKRLISLLPDDYKSYTKAYYWKAAFVPHPKILGSVGMVLAIISKYKIEKSIRYQLPVMPDNILVKQFQFKRAILEAVVPFKEGGEISIMATHLDAFAQGNDTMEKQVKMTFDILSDKTKQNKYWLIAGDFNLLPPGKAYERLGDYERQYYKKDTELKKLTDCFNVIPSLEEMNNEGYEKWFTHYPNNPIIKGPDRTIDYVFYSSNLIRKEAYVRQKDTTNISDHMPIIAVFEVK